MLSKRIERLTSDLNTIVKAVEKCPLSTNEHWYFVAGWIGWESRLAYLSPSVELTNNHDLFDKLIYWSGYEWYNKQCILFLYWLLICPMSGTIDMTSNVNDKIVMNQ